MKRGDVLEVMAEEISNRQGDKLASFQSFDGDGRRRLDGMSKGRRWDIDREQRAWEKANAAELAKYECRHRWAKHEKAHPDRCAAARAQWAKVNRAHLLTYRARYAKENVERERQWAKNKRAKIKADPERHARDVAKYKRYREKLKRDPVRWAAKLKTMRERKRKMFVAKHTRKCRRCRETGHNRTTCTR